MPSITAPAAGTFYTAGTTVNFAGSATDPDTGPMSGSAFTWRVDFHHADHAHPHLQAATGSTSGSFVIPNTGETATDVFYRIVLTVTDSAGLSATTTRDVAPRTAQITLASSPAARSRGAQAHRHPARSLARRRAGSPPSRSGCWLVGR